MFQVFVRIHDVIAQFLTWLAPLGDLIIRLWVGKIFFLSGLYKIQAWDHTLRLFTYQYSVPFLPPYWAALIATVIETVTPVFLILGLGGRFPALILFLFNLVVVGTHSYLQTSTGWVALNNHIYWGLLLLVLMVHGSGKLSVDNLVR